LAKKQIFLCVPTKLILYTSFLIILAISGISCKKKAKVVESYNTYTISSGQKINNTCWLSNFTGFACGGERSTSGKIYKTIDGGANWNEVSSNTGYALYDICFINDSIGYCSGEKFQMLYTLNSGKTWQNFAFAWKPGNYENCTLRNLTKINNRVLVTGGDNYNVGITFQFSYNQFYYVYSHPDNELRGSMSFNDGNYFVFGYGYAFKSKDSLKTYQPINLTNDFFTGSCAINNSLGYVCGYNGGIYTTKNAGHDWEKLENVNNLLSSRDHFNSIFFTDELHGWCVGNTGLILNTTNGKDWKKVEYTGKENLLSIRLKSGNTVVVSTSDGQLLEFN
jgi:photosystem II stability/assembly factor-like uncharacterized protein